MKKVAFGIAIVFLAAVAAIILHHHTPSGAPVARNAATAPVQVAQAIKPEYKMVSLPKGTRLVMEPVVADYRTQ